jgi:acyl-CoA reductase-like NAD-dependent aldehyde dehydrogenase
VKGGAQLATGGKRSPRRRWSRPYCSTRRRCTKVSQQEVFGPVVCVYRYGDLDEAIARANALPVAFQASVFAQDIDVAMRAANRLDASAVMINDPTAFRTDWMPFAGRRESGYGTGGIPLHHAGYVAGEDDPHRVLGDADQVVEVLVAQRDGAGRHQSENARGG